MCSGTIEVQTMKSGKSLVFGIVVTKASEVQAGSFVKTNRGEVDES